jgi:two-component system OmpR family response regulator
VPILFLTARDDEVDRIVGLELGADDYVTKPFSPRELVARVRAILKRSGAVAAPQQRLMQGRLVLDAKARLCRYGETDLTLTATEFQMLAVLMADPARLLPRAALVSALWGAHSLVADRTLDSHLRNLRRKLAEAGGEGAIETVHGQGMRLGPCI